MVKILSLAFVVIVLILMVVGWYQPWQVYIVKEGLKELESRILKLYRCTGVRVFIGNVYDGPEDKLGIIIRNEGEIKINKGKMGIYYEGKLVEVELNGTLGVGGSLDILITCKDGWSCDCSEGFSGEEIRVCTECGICDSQILTDSFMRC